MYEIYRRAQRKRISSESYTSHTFLLMPSEGEFQAYGSLTHCLETVQKAGTRIQRGPFRRSLVLTIPASGAVEVSTETLGALRLERGSLAKTTPVAGEYLTYEAPAGEGDASYLEFGIQLPEDAGAAGTERAAIDSRGPRPLLLPLASGQEGSAALTLPIDCDLYMAFLRAGENFIFETAVERILLLIVLEGIVRFEEHRMLDGDSARISHVSRLEVAAPERSRLLLVDMP